MAVWWFIIAKGKRRKKERKKEREGGREGRKKTKCLTVGNFSSDQTLNLVSTYYAPDLLLSTFRV